MNIEILIDSIIKQTTVLIAQLATCGGVRAPLAGIANQVFVELAQELERQGLNQKVTADMFGVSLRTYRRKMQRLKESSTDRGSSLWEAIIGYLEKESVVTRYQILERFHRDDELLVRGILHDLVDNGFVFCSGAKKNAVFRIATKEELESVRKAYGEQGADELIWVVIFHEGPILRDRLIERLELSSDKLDPVLNRLIAEGRVRAEQRKDGIYYCCEKFVIPLGSEKGWEASVYDHFHAMVQTICNRLNQESESAVSSQQVGGSTYQFDIGPGHPFAQEVLNILSDFRQRCSQIRERVVGYNQEHGLCEPLERVTVYAGQCVIPQESPTKELSSKSKMKGKSNAS